MILNSGTICNQTKVTSIFSCTCSSSGFSVDVVCFMNKISRFLTLLSPFQGRRTTGIKGEKKRSYSSPTNLAFHLCLDCFSVYHIWFLPTAHTVKRNRRYSHDPNYFCRLSAVISQTVVSYSEPERVPPLSPLNHVQIKESTLKHIDLDWFLVMTVKAKIKSVTLYFLHFEQSEISTQCSPSLNIL